MYPDIKNQGPFQPSLGQYICVKHRNDCFLITDFLFFRDGAVDTESCQELIGECIDKMRESNDLSQSFSRSSEGVN